jgi:hypothetical protein
MKTVLIYRPNSETERRALDYIREFTAQTRKTLQTLDPDSPEGADFCRLYEVMEYPAIVVTDDEGHMQNMWMSDQLPTYSELSYYVAEQSAGKTNV